MEFEPKVWSKAYFETHSKSDSTENNISECFNAWILKSRYMPLIDMLTDIHDLLMERLHKKRDAMNAKDCIVVPRIKKLVDEAVKESNECSVLWDGKENFQVKWRGIGHCVNLRDGTCSCRVWELSGIPCSHAISAIHKMRKDPIDYVAHWFKKDTYMKTYSHCLEVLRGEPFWEDTLGDEILPPPIVKQLRGRPKRQRRREGWEGRGGRVTKGSFSRLTKMGRVMHCGICRQRGHKRGVCPNKPSDYVEKPTKKRAPQRKTLNTDEAELVEEMERAEQEVETGEAQLMEEAFFNETEVIAPPPTTPRRSQRLEKQIQSPATSRSEGLVFVSLKACFNFLCIPTIKYF